MSESKAKPRVALLGARQSELELMAELHRLDRVDLVAVYDPDPQAVGLALAEIIGIAAGSSTVARERLRDVEIVILPENRLAMREAIEWSSGLRSELISLHEARKRWGTGAVRALQPLPPTAAAAQLQNLDEARTRLRTPIELAEWLLETVMRAVGATGGSIQLLATNGAELYLLAARGLSERVVRHARQPLGNPVAGLAAAIRKPQLIHGDREGGPTRERGSLSSGMSIPLELEDGSVLGVVNVSTSVPGHQFEETQLQTLMGLAPRIANLLRRAREHETSEARRAQAAFVDLLRSLEAQDLDLQGSLSTLCKHLCSALEAEMVALYLATDEGDWLLLSGADRTGGEHRLPASRGAAGKAYLERRWVQLAETPVHPQAPQPPSTDTISDAVDAALAADSTLEPTHSCVYAPLVGTRPLGILTAEFSQLAVSERFMEQGDEWVQKISLYVETRIRERRMNLRVQRLSKLARIVPELLEARKRGSLDEEIARQAARLANAERAIFRRVDEPRRTYSPPVLVGVPETEATAWRTLDANVSEKTLQRRESLLTTTMKSETDRLDESVGYRSLISVPVVLRERIVGLLNVYDKMPQDMLDSYTFSNFDLELVESLAYAIAALMDDREPPPTSAPSASAAAGGDSAASLAADTHGTAAATSPSAPATAPGATAPQPTSPEPSAVDGPSAATRGERAEQQPTIPTESPQDRNDLLRRFERETAAAAREQRELVIVRLRIAGLTHLEAEEREPVLERLLRVLRGMVESDDLAGRHTSEELLVVSRRESVQRPHLQAEFSEALQRELADAADSEIQFVVTSGSSSYPHDGWDVHTLLQAAAPRQ